MTVLFWGVTITLNLRKTLANKMARYSTKKVSDNIHFPLVIKGLRHKSLEFLVLQLLSLASADFEILRYLRSSKL